MQSVKIWNDIYTILVEECGASETERESFVTSQMSPDYPREWRFSGDLGFGGKFWRVSSYFYVNCYQEDETTERKTKIDKTNKRLVDFLDKRAMESSKKTKDGLRLSTILHGMDVPSSRKDVSKPENIAWLILNISIRNAS